MSWYKSIWDPFSTSLLTRMDASIKLEQKRAQRAATNLERLIRLEKRNKAGIIPDQSDQ